MATYVYGCKNKDHPTITAAHSMLDNPEIRCSVCGQILHRIPQGFRWGFAAGDTLLDSLDKGYRSYRTRKARRTR
jgi:hypothetical protein